MPELPEVETTLRGISPFVLHQTISAVIITQFNLRWQIPKKLAAILSGQTIEKITRRGKYLLFQTATGTLLIHLGMSGRLLVKPHQHTVVKHEHVNLNFTNGYTLCYIDPRRFGAILWSQEEPQQHKLLKHLGIEPLERKFSGNYLFQHAQKHKTSVKQFIMDSHIVTGVGNIYASEALYLAKIRPDTPANRVTQERYNLLVKSIKQVLTLAIKNCGTTIRDFATSSGEPGAFQNKLQVYGQQGKPCKKCKTILEQIRLGQRSTVFCPKCQK